MGDTKFIRSLPLLDSNPHLNTTVGIAINISIELFSYRLDFIPFNIRKRKRTDLQATSLIGVTGEYQCDVSLGACLSGSGVNK